MKSIWQQFIQDGSGNKLVGASITVRKNGTIAAIYENKSGTISRANPFLSDSKAKAWFYADAGLYDIEVTAATGTTSLYDVAVGTAQAQDMIADGGIVLSDAPSDGKQYARKDGDWEEVEDYTLPTASNSVLGGVKVGGGLSIDGGGVLSSTAGSTLSNKAIVTEGTDFDITLPLNSNIKLRLKKTTGVQEVELYFKFDSLHNCWCYGSQFSDAAVETKISVQGDTTTEKNTYLKVFNKGSNASDMQYVQMNLASQSNNNKWQLTLFCSYYTSTQTIVFYQLSAIS